ncbi:TlpA family protein disulfide reductase [Streptococcus sp. S784/96/1]|uniref:TlpA family protein disulfide reductase n=1 Tax=Streptococcus sp. S784/96/1 TaxID=2653499 RepID=UPI00138A6A34|nr:TlpA family protein disulfide reductase [Streptococcus sp. S784/96/1]
MSRYKGFIFLILSLILVTAGLTYVFHQGQNRYAPTSDTKTLSKPAVYDLEGQKLPTFTLTASDGTEVSSEQFKDKPMIYVQWASWCPDCQRVLPMMQNLYDKYSGKVTFIFANATGTADGQETREAVTSYITDKQFTFPYYYDEQLATASQLQIENVPTLLFVTADGVVKEVNVEARGLRERDLEEMLKNIL